MKNFKPFFSVLITLGVVLLFYVKRFIVLKYYPPLCNGFIFFVFFISLFTKETIIQKFARLCGDKLEMPAWNYTRKLTYIWCVFIFVNWCISIWTIFLPDKIWILYNGFISYVLIGILFGVEYIVRIVLRKRKLI